MGNVKVKICGLSRYEDIAYINQIKAEYAGFVLYHKKSPRYVEIEKARQLMAQLHKDVLKVAVTVAPTVAQVKEIEAAGFDILQVHGELSGDVIRETILPIFRAVNLEHITDCQNIESDDKITGYVFDGKLPGSGETFDWHLLDGFKREDKLLLLAGGLNADNVSAGINALKPDIVDVSSGVEGADGYKSGDKIITFVNCVRERGIV